MQAKDDMSAILDKVIDACGFHQVERKGEYTAKHLDADIAFSGATKTTRLNRGGAILGNLAYILGRKLTWDGEQVVGDEQANRLLSRPQRYPYVL